MGVQKGKTLWRLQRAGSRAYHVARRHAGVVFFDGCVARVWLGGRAIDGFGCQWDFLNGLMGEVRPARVCDGKRLFLISKIELMCRRAVLNII